MLYKDYIRLFKFLIHQHFKKEGLNKGKKYKLIKWERKQNTYKELNKSIKPYAGI